MSWPCWLKNLGEVTFALEFGGHDAVLAGDGGRDLSRVAEKNGVARIRFGEAGDERLAADGDAVSIALVFGIGRRLAGQDKRLGVENGVAASPENYPMKLAEAGGRGTR